MEVLPVPSLRIISRSSICTSGSLEFVPRSSGCSFIVRSAKGNNLGSNNGETNKNQGENVSTDWDKAWSNFRKQGKKSLFSQFDMEKYVTRDPRPSDFPLSEEIDPLRKTERSALNAWTSPNFTIAGFGIVVGLLIFYIALK